MSMWARVAATKDAKTREIAPGVFAPLPVEAETDRSGDRTQRLRIVADVHGDESVCLKFELEGKRAADVVTREDLRRIPLPLLAGSAVREVCEPGAWITAFGQDPESVDWAAVGEAARSLGPVEDSLRAAAFLYNRGVVTTGNPTQEVELELGLPRPTASRWVRQAREAGFIPSD